jgi:TrmH family RNA methyltransferase
MRPPEPIASRGNAFVKRLRSLKDRRHRELALLEGVKLVEEALAAGVQVVEAATAPALRSQPRGTRLLQSLRAAGVAVREVTADVLASLSETEHSQGVLAIAERPGFDEKRLFEGTPLVLIAVQVQDPGNLGALLRAAEAAGATGAYLTRGTADPFSWKALRGSMGSAFRLPHVAGLEVQDAIARVRGAGLATVAAVGHGGVRYDLLDLGVPTALIVGNEGTGLPEEAVAAAERSATIPVRAPVESLNVAVAAGVLLFEAARQRSGPSR